VQMDAPYEWRIELMRKVASLLQPIAVPRSLETVLSARVPVIKMMERRTGVECDICVCNRDGVFKSHTFRELSRIDHRFPDLVRLVCSLSCQWLL
jgi:DNA polymerase sigma